MSLFTGRYGRGPGHLVAHLLAFAFCAWAFSQILRAGNAVNYAAWFLGAALLHDLILLPFYSLLDRLVGLPARARPTVARVPLVNHLRVPALLSGLLLLVYLPLILGLSAVNYRNDTGHALSGYTRNWLLVSLGFFLASALVMAIRVGLRRRDAADGP